MHTYIAILRGINVSGHKIIKMEALRALCESLGFKNTKTYIQSGNIIFQCKKTIPAELEKKITTAIAETFNFEVPVIVKDANDLKTVIKNNPFLKRKEDITKLHVTFLNNEPDKSSVDKIKECVYTEDEFTLSEKAVYLFCTNGYGNTKLTNTFFENKLKVSATTRNLKTLTELLNIAEQVEQL
ncbi:MAG: DUF1697 domain-containing protein [Bacteroidota bacterium]